MDLKNLPITPVRKPSYSQEEVDNAIQSSANTLGVPVSFMNAMATQESSKNPYAMAPTSSAKGLFQFIDSTWDDMVNRYGKKHGITPENADRFDPKQNAILGAEFTAQNKRTLENAGFKDINDTDLYMAHFMGAGGAKKFLKALRGSPKEDASKMFPKEAKANPWVFKGRTVEDVYKFLGKKIGSYKTPPTPGRKPIDPSVNLDELPNIVVRPKQRKPQVNIPTMGQGMDEDELVQSLVKMLLGG